jgi:hypothetical protein
LEAIGWASPKSPALTKVRLHALRDHILHHGIGTLCDRSWFDVTPWWRNARSLGRSDAKGREEVRAPVIGTALDGFLSRGMHGEGGAVAVSNVISAKPR